VNVDFHPDVCKQLQQLPRPVFAAALRMIVGLANQPRPVGAVKLVGSKNDRRVRISEYRIVYEINDQAQTVTVFRVAHRREVYGR
jgi:mRNA interferase RelE/StbE